jgi:hypothetical protein
MRKIIKITESDLEQIVKKVLSEQKSKWNPLGLEFGQKEPKSDINGPIHQLQQKLMDAGFLKTKSMVPTGYFGPMTKNALERAEGKPTTKTETQPKKNQKEDYNCVAISAEECKKISSNKETVISTGAEMGCSKYMIKCLSEFDKDVSGHAWTALLNLKNRNLATEKYNMFKDVDWNNIWKTIDKKVSSKVCACHKKDHADGICNSGIPELVIQSLPQTPKISLSDLKLGDIVGLYYSPSTNKGQAFCGRLEFDEKGKPKKTGPFEFNSHVGFVVAIKNGVPIILHNIGENRYATPATKLLNKNGTMITWVATDNEVAKNLAAQNTPNIKLSLSNYPMIGVNKK